MARRSPLLDTCTTCGVERRYGECLCDLEPFGPDLEPWGPSDPTEVLDLAIEASDGEGYPFSPFATIEDIEVSDHTGTRVERLHIPF